MRVILLTMQMASGVTASVSRTFMLVHTDRAMNLAGAINRASWGE